MDRSSRFRYSSQFIIAYFFSSVIFQLSEKDLVPRTPATYNHMCTLLSSLNDGYHSTTFGINRRSPLNELCHYHVCDYGLPPDVMHDLLEGYLPYTLKLMLSHFITTLKLFTLDELNQAIKNFDYGYAETSRPQCLTSDSLSISKGCTTFPLSGKLACLLGLL